MKNVRMYCYIFSEASLRLFQTKNDVAKDYNPLYFQRLYCASFRLQINSHVAEDCIVFSGTDSQL